MQRLIHRPNDHSGGMGDLPVSFVYSSRISLGVPRKTNRSSSSSPIISELMPLKIMAEIAGDRRGGVQEHAVAAAAHEERDRLVHPLVLNAVGVVGPQHDLLAALVEAGERFAAAENFFAGRQRERRVDAARIIRRAAHERERQDRA